MTDDEKRLVGLETTCRLQKKRIGALEKEVSRLHMDVADERNRVRQLEMAIGLCLNQPTDAETLSTFKHLFGDK